MEVVNVAAETWSYSHFMFLLYEPFNAELENVDLLISFTDEEVTKLIARIYNHLEFLVKKMNNESIAFRENKIYIYCFDIEYDYPDDYKFVDACRNFVRSCGIIIFNHLDNYEVIKKYLYQYKRQICNARHPLTGDTIWHLSPFIIDILEASLDYLFNFRKETPYDRRYQVEIFNFPILKRFPLDKLNEWNLDTKIFVEKCEQKEIRDPLSMCRIIKKLK